MIRCIKIDSISDGPDIEYVGVNTKVGIHFLIGPEFADKLESVLNSALDMLAPEGRLSIISFHSLEDRMVKHFMRKQSKGEDIPRGLPLREDQIQRNQKLKIIGKAIQPSEAEISANPRSRSSVLRIAERVK